MSARKPPARYDERTFKLAPKRAGAGYQVVEVLGAVDNAPLEIKIRRWDVNAKDFTGPSRIKRSQIIGDVPDGDPRIAQIKGHIAQKIAEFETAQAAAEKRAS